MVNRQIKASDKDSLLSFEDIHFAYSPAGKQVIHNLSLSVEENSITAILGPNGSGKTTLLYLALGWLKPFSVILNWKEKRFKPIPAVNWTTVRPGSAKSAHPL